MKKAWSLSLLAALILSPLCLANMRDPTRPENYQGWSAGDQVQTSGLQAIIISKSRRFAIFNGQTLRLGSQVEGFKVVSIQANTVHLEGPDGKMTLFLFNHTIKKSASKRT